MGSKAPVMASPVGSKSGKESPRVSLRGATSGGGLASCVLRPLGEYAE
jgi:hypothetical protein